MPTYEEAWTKGGEALSKKYGGDKSKFIAAAKAYNQKKYGTTEPTRDGKKKATETANNERISSVVNKTNEKAKGGAGALPKTFDATLSADGRSYTPNDPKYSSAASRKGMVPKLSMPGKESAKKAENSEVRSSSSNPNTEYGKYKKSMEGSGKETHGGLSAVAGKKKLKTGMGYSEESGRKEKVYNKEGKKVAVTKRTKDSAKMRLTRAGRKDKDTTLTVTKKSGKTKVKGAPKQKQDSARTVAKKALGVGTKNPDGSTKEVKKSAIRKKAGDVRTKRRKIKNQNY